MLLILNGSNYDSDHAVEDDRWCIVVTPAIILKGSQLREEEAGHPTYLASIAIAWQVAGFFFATIFSARAYEKSDYKI